jgi:hypothetical protein
MQPLTPEALSLVAASGAVVALIALLLGASLRRRIARLENHYRLLMQDVEGTDLAADLETIARRLGATEEAGEAAAARAQATDERLASAIRHVRTMRYNAFGDAGGDQSFAIAMLDDSGDGVVISTLHARDGVRVYAKPVAGGRSAYAMSTEEERVVSEAMAGRA